MKSVSRELHAKNSIVVYNWCVCLFQNHKDIIFKYYVQVLKSLVWENLRKHLLILGNLKRLKD